MSISALQNTGNTGAGRRRCKGILRFARNIFLDGLACRSWLSVFLAFLSSTGADRAIQGGLKVSSQTNNWTSPTTAYRWCSLCTGGSRLYRWFRRERRSKQFRRLLATLRGAALPWSSRCLWRRLGWQIGMPCRGAFRCLRSRLCSLSRRTRLLCCCGSGSSSFLRLAAEGSSRFDFRLLLRCCSRGGSSLLDIFFLDSR